MEELRVYPSQFDVEYSTTLDGVTYRLRWRWIERTQRWVLDVADVDGALLVGGVAVVLLVPLLSRHRHTATSLPQGVLFAFSLDDDDQADPRFGDLGTRVRVMYIPRAEALKIGADQLASLTSAAVTIEETP